MKVDSLLIIYIQICSWFISITTCLEQRKLVAEKRAHPMKEYDGVSDVNV